MIDLWIGVSIGIGLCVAIALIFINDRFDDGNPA